MYRFFMDMKHSIEVIPLDRLTIKKNVRTIYDENEMEDPAATTWQACPGSTPYLKCLKKRYGKLRITLKPWRP